MVNRRRIIVSISYATVFSALYCIFDSVFGGLGAQTTTPKPCILYDQFNLKGNETTVTRNCDTFDPDLGGLRPFFAQYHSGLQITSLNLLTNDVLNKAGQVQTYVGEKPTYTQGAIFLATHNLDWYGLNTGSQIALTFIENSNTYRQLGIDGFFINRLSVFLPFFNDRVFLQYGYYQVANAFYGTAIGANAGTNALGPQSSLLFQSGVQGFRPALSVDVKILAPDKRFYNRFGIFRSISANGTLYDARQNYYGLAFDVPGGSAAFINEIGFKTDATPESKKIWLRAGGVYNTSPYRVLGGAGNTEDNYAFYVVGDVQLSQSNPAVPSLGWYVNARYNVGSERLNVYSSDVGTTLYKFGTFASRPYDLFSISFTHTNVSSLAQDLISRRGISPTKSTESYGVSYGYKLYDGLYLQPSLTYTTHPTVNSKQPAALNFSATLAFLL